MAEAGLGPILVTGATGRQGGAVVRHLKKRGCRVRALTRNSSKPSARALAESGVEVVSGDLDKPDSLLAALRGMRGVFSVQNWWETGTAGEIRQGKNVADAARAAKVELLVYSSVGGAQKQPDITHWRTKWEVENH